MANLILEFTLSGSNRLHHKRAARIFVDGSGAVVYYEHQTGAAGRLVVSKLQYFSIHDLSRHN